MINWNTNCIYQKLSEKFIKNMFLEESFLNSLTKEQKRDYEKILNSKLSHKKTETYDLIMKTLKTVLKKKQFKKLSSKKQFKKVKKEIKKVLFKKVLFKKEV